jgi:hypothetical protein
MRIRHCVAVSLAAIVVGLVACGGSASSSCGNYFDQSTAAEQKCDPSATADTSSKGNFENLCTAIVKAPGVSNFTGQIDSCASQVGSAACGANVNCKIVGTLADGTACGVGVQCAGSLCVSTTTTPDPNSEVTCGKCASYTAVGGQCGTTSTNECDPATSACMNGACTAYASQGQSCASAPCATGLSCDPQAKTCGAPPTKGQACPGFECATPYKCIAGSCADAVQAGGACPTGFECADSLSCDQQTKTCTAPTLAPAGQPCGFVQNQIVDCQSGLQCQQSGNGQGTCVAPKEAGAACTVGKGECATFLACINSVCAVPDYSVCQ